MSLMINVQRVKEVLLPDGWHEVANSSFDMDAYEYSFCAPDCDPGCTKHMCLKGGASPLVTSTGASWSERDQYGKSRTVSCPLTAIQAVSTGWAD